MDILIGRAKGHDQEAFGNLIKAYTVSMYKVAKAILKNSIDIC